ncbi:MAG TPA: TIGR00300 family protein [Spirochaetia bacterium]|nr:TIGR00300 family protein [Spirochaetia bacterium]
MTRRFTASGHLIDSGIMTTIFNLIIGEGADYKVVSFDIGRMNEEYSTMELDLIATDEEQIEVLTQKLVQAGCYEKTAPEAALKPAPRDGCVPDDFYSTTNHRTEVFVDGQWSPVAAQRMDAAIVLGKDGAVCTKVRDVRAGDLVVCNAESVRVFPPFRDRQGDLFGFMTNDVSSERSVDVIVDKVAHELEESRLSQKKVVFVAGPVLVHTGGSVAFQWLIRNGYVNGLLAGNALAVHDIESVLYGTSLGVGLTTGRPTHEGHKNHMRAINRVRFHGSIKAAIDAGALTSGIMYETLAAGVPYCLAGSIRDDGPLPETVNDMIEAQTQYARIVSGAGMVIMLSSMLHSIGTGNMLPSWVKTVCVDINPAVVTKLADRGSSQAVGVVSDVGFFLRALAARLDTIRQEPDQH